MLANGLTLERIALMISQMNERNPLPLPPADGLPLVFGAIPFAFSLALFLLPLLRALRRPSEARKVARENGWQGRAAARADGAAGPGGAEPGGAGPGLGGRRG